MKIKSRKLFAILVITAMVLAMLPMTAFAADPVYGVTSVSVNETQLTIGESAEVTLTFYGSDGLPQTDVNFDFYIKSSRANAETVAPLAVAADRKGTISPAAFAIPGAAGEAVTVTALSNSQLNFAITSAFAGTTTISFWDGLANDEDSSKFGEVTLTFSAAKFSNTTSTFTATPTESAIFGNVALAATLKNANGTPIKDTTVTFQKQYEGGAWTTITTKNTNVLGVSSINTTESVTGKYNYRARVGSDTVDAAVEVTFTGTQPTAINAVTVDGGVAVDELQKVKFKVTDAFGNVVKGQDVELKLDKRPSGATAYATTTPSTDKDGEVTFEFTPNKVGEYQVKATVDGTGLTKTVTLTAATFGDVASVTLALEKDRVSLKSGASDGSEEMTLSAKLVDVNGNIKTASSSDVRLSTSNVGLVSVSGLDVIASTDSKKIGTATITATHIASGKSASVVVPVVGGPATITDEVVVADKTATITLQFVDSEGNKTWDSLTATTGYDVYVPAGVAKSEIKAFAAKSGKATFKVVAEEYGTYVVTVVTDNGLSKTVSVVFGAPVPEITANVVMFIGSATYVQNGEAVTADAAPFIEDGRTFVPLRFIGEAFGADMDWDPKDAAVETVTVTLGDVVIVITIGEYAIQVISDGGTETVVSDAAAFIKDGRTFLPLRAIGEILGAEFDWGPKDGATEWVSFSK